MRSQSSSGLAVNLPSHLVGLSGWHYFKYDGTRDRGSVENLIFHCIDTLASSVCSCKQNRSFACRLNCNYRYSFMKFTRVICYPDQLVSGNKKHQEIKVEGSLWLHVTFIFHKTRSRLPQFIGHLAAERWWLQKSLYGQLLSGNSMNSHFPVKDSWQHSIIMRIVIPWVDVTKCILEDSHIINLNQTGVSQVSKGLGHRLQLLITDTQNE